MLEASENEEVDQFEAIKDTTKKEKEKSLKTTNKMKNAEKNIKSKCSESSEYTFTNMV